jgi:hypothetical protein
MKRLCSSSEEICFLCNTNCLRPRRALSLLRRWNNIKQEELTEAFTCKKKITGNILLKAKNRLVLRGSKITSLKIEVEEYFFKGKKISQG